MYYIANKWMLASVLQRQLKHLEFLFLWFFLFVTRFCLACFARSGGAHYDSARTFFLWICITWGRTSCAGLWILTHRDRIATRSEAVRRSHSRVSLSRGVSDSAIATENRSCEWRNSRWRTRVCIFVWICRSIHHVKLIATTITRAHASVLSTAMRDYGRVLFSQLA